MLHLYQGVGYFDAFCTRLSRFYDDHINFAFSSAFSLCPDAAIVSDSESDSDLDTEDWYSPSSEPAPSKSPAPPDERCETITQLYNSA